MKNVPYSPGLLSISSMIFLISSQGSVYFSNTSLFLSVEAKTKYLFPFFSSIDNLALNQPLIAIKDSEYVKIHSVNTLYLIIGEVDVSIEAKKWK